MIIEIFTSAQETLSGFDWKGSGDKVTNFFTSLWKNVAKYVGKSSSSPNFVRKSILFRSRNGPYCPEKRMV